MLCSIAHATENFSIFFFWSELSSSSTSRSNLQQGHIPANTNMKDAVGVPGGERRLLLLV